MTDFFSRKSQVQRFQCVTQSTKNIAVVLIAGVLSRIEMNV